MRWVLWFDMFFFERSLEGNFEDKFRTGVLFDWIINLIVFGGILHVMDWVGLLLVLSFENKILIPLLLILNWLGRINWLLWEFFFDFLSILVLHRDCSDMIIKMWGIFHLVEFGSVKIIKEVERFGKLRNSIGKKRENISTVLIVWK